MKNRKIAWLYFEYATLILMSQCTYVPAYFQVIIIGSYTHAWSPNKFLPYAHGGHHGSSFITSRKWIN